MGRPQRSTGVAPSALERGSGAWLGVAAARSLSRSRCFDVSSSRHDERAFVGATLTLGARTQDDPVDERNTLHSAFSQFLAHDLMHTETQDISEGIAVPQGDPWFDPFSVRRALWVGDFVIISVSMT